MKNKQLEQLVLESKKDKNKLNGLVEAYKPFIASCTQKITGRYLQYGADDELSIAMMAFMQAVEKYCPENGEFLSFAKKIIHSRVIDYYRSQKKHSQRIVYFKTEEEEEAEDMLETQMSMNVYHEESSKGERLSEIQVLTDTLARFDISFSDLEKVAPKNRQTKKICKEVVGYIIGEPHMLKEILKNKSFPLAQLEERLSMKRKKFERHRKYILTVLIILSGDYPYLSEYVKDYKQAGW